MKPVLVVALVGSALALQGCLLIAAKRAGLIGGSGPEVTITANRHSADITVNDDGDSNYSMGDGPNITAAGPLTTDAREVGDFHGVAAGAVIKLHYTQGPACSVKISAQENVLPLVKTNVEDGVLKITLAGSVTQLKEVDAVVTSPSIDSLELSGAARGDAKDIKTDSLALDVSGSAILDVEAECQDLKAETSGSANLKGRLVAQKSADLDLSGNSVLELSGTSRDSVKADVSGASQLTFSGIETDTAEVNASGNSQVTMTGRAKSAHLVAEGASKIGEMGFAVDVCEAEASGASNLSITANTSLKADASGASHVEYGGRPTVVQDVSGVSSVNQG